MMPFPFPRSLSFALLLPLLALRADPAVAQGVPGEPPCVNEQAKLQAADLMQYTELGYSVAVDGDTVVAGAIQWVGSAHGLAYVFHRQGAIWSEQAVLAASDRAAGDIFGHSVSISGDRVVVGAPRDDHSGLEQAGSVYVFVRNGSQWTQEAKLTALDAFDFDWFGRSVVVEGDTIVVGAPYADYDDPNDATGNVYVFRRSGGVWSQQQRLRSSEPINHSHFGYSVDLSGERLVVGAQGHGRWGAAFVFVDNSGVFWSEEAKLLPQDATNLVNRRFGCAVSISGDTIVVGDRKDRGAGVEFSGSAYIFRRENSLWNETLKVVPPQATSPDEFGFSVAAADENTVIIGAPGLFPSPGQAFVYQRVGGAWSPDSREVVASDGDPGDDFGYSVAGSGSTVAVGARLDWDGAPIAGSAYAFVLGPDSDPPRIDCPPDLLLVASDVSLPVSYGVGASDLCDPAPLVQADPPSGTVLPPGETVVASLAVDERGNASSCHFTVTVDPRVDFDRDPAGIVADGTLITDQYLDLEVRISGLSDTGQTGAVARVPGPPGSSTASIVPVTAPNYLQTFGGDDEGDSGILTFDFVDRETGDERKISFVALTFLDIEESGSGGSGRGVSRLEAFDAQGTLVGQALVPVGPEGGSHTASIGDPAGPLEITRVVAVVGDPDDSGGWMRYVSSPVTPPSSPASWRRDPRFPRAKSCDFTTSSATTRRRTSRSSSRCEELPTSTGPAGLSSDRWGGATRRVRAPRQSPDPADSRSGGPPQVLESPGPLRGHLHRSRHGRDPGRIGGPGHPPSTGGIGAGNNRAFREKASPVNTQRGCFLGFRSAHQGRFPVSRRSSKDLSP